MNSVAYSPNGQLFVTAGDDGKVKVWNSRSGFCFVTFNEHTAPVHSVVFSPKGSGHALFSASADGTVRAFDLVRYRNFRTFVSPTPAQFSCLAIDPSGEVVCT
jgi:periodic tryptophan protein 2